MPVGGIHVAAGPDSDRLISHTPRTVDSSTHLVLLPSLTSDISFCRSLLRARLLAVEGRVLR
jgi:hypothetical protein